MNILIVSHARSGSTSLLNALSDIYSLEKIYEPFNIDAYRWDEDSQRNWTQQMKILLSDDDSTSNKFLDKKILKIQAGNIDTWVWENLSKFDKVIFLLRNNIKDAFESVVNANRYGWEMKYNATEDINFSTREDYNYITRQYGIIVKFLRKLNNTEKIYTIWYDDLYKDFDTTKQTLLNLDSSFTEDDIYNIWNGYLNPSLRLRQKDD